MSKPEPQRSILPNKGGGAAEGKKKGGLGGLMSNMMGGAASDGDEGESAPASP